MESIFGRRSRTFEFCFHAVFRSADAREANAAAVGKVKRVTVNNVGYGESGGEKVFGKEIAKEKTGEENEEEKNNFDNHLFILAVPSPLHYYIVT